MNAEAGAPVHGGDLDAVARRYGVDRATLLDFSANVNPLGPPLALRDALAAAARDLAALQRYPEPTYRALREALARELSVDAEAVVVGNGAAALLDAALAASGARRCIVPIPAFSEYARALAARNMDMVPFRLDPRAEFRLDRRALVAAVKASGAQTMLLSNPHNPSGTLVARADLIDLVDELADAGCRTIVDEAFIDYVPEHGVCDAAAAGMLVCVRSLTKFYAVPALRVGYLVCAPRSAASHRAQLASWSVTSLAAAAVHAALGDADFATRSLSSNAVERARLRAALVQRGCRVPEAAANFVLAELPERCDASAIVERLIRESGIVVRDCTTYAGLERARWIRVAVRSATDNARLIAALDSVLNVSARA